MEPKEAHPLAKLVDSLVVKPMEVMQMGSLGKMVGAMGLPKRRIF